MHNAIAAGLAPAAVRPDVLMRSVTAEVTAILKHDAAAGQPTDVAQLVGLEGLRRQGRGHLPGDDPSRRVRRDRPRGRIDGLIKALADRNR